MEQQYGMRALGDGSGDFLQVRLHGLRHGARQGERRADAYASDEGRLA